jgi:DNA-binding transcriptional ArsR family regulator
VAAGKACRNRIVLTPIPADVGSRWLLTASMVSAYLRLATAYLGCIVTHSSTKLAALGDATRRRILELLAEAPASVAEITDQVPVSRPAVSQHLKVLSEAGLVVHRVDGTRHLYQADPNGLAELRKYLDSLWETALGRFQADAQRASTSRRTVRRKSK